MKHFHIITSHLSIALLMCFTLQIQAQGNLPGGFKHIIEVGRYSDYGKNYLTITDPNIIWIDKVGETQPIHPTYTIDDPKLGNDARFLFDGDLILEVDGVSAAGWTKEKFYKMIDGRHDIIKLKIRSKTNSKIIEYETKIFPLYELPDNLAVYGNSLAISGGQTPSQERKKGKASYEERLDEDFDFFPCLFYDFYLSSSDPLLDKEILKEMSFGSLKRDEERPDILITIARNADESISSTYIPPSSRVVNEGSTTRVRYNYLTKQNDYITTQKNRTIYEGGYTKETKTADIFLEIAALDVKKLNDKSTNHPPVVWKTTAKRHVVNPEFNYNEDLKAYASWMALPPSDRTVYVKKTIYAPVGVLYSEEDPLVIKEVIRGSRAEKIGLMPGDKLLKANMPYSQMRYGPKYVKKDLKKKGWAVVGYYLDETYSVEVLRNGSKMSFILSPSSITIWRSYFVGAE